MRISEGAESLSGRDRMEHTKQFANDVPPKAVRLVDDQYVNALAKRTAPPLRPTTGACRPPSESRLKVV